MKWFSENKMFVNPEKFKSIIIQGSNQTSKLKQPLIGNDVVEVASSVELLGIHIEQCVLQLPSALQISKDFTRFQIFDQIFILIFPLF